MVEDTTRSDKAFAEFKMAKKWKVVTDAADPMTVNGDLCKVEVHTEDDFIVCLPINSVMAEYIVTLHNEALKAG